jgi:hypothetical protein
VCDNGIGSGIGEHSSYAPLHPAASRGSLKSANWFPITTIIVLLGLSITNTVNHVANTRNAFINHADTSNDTIAFINSPTPLGILGEATQAVMFTLADCILVSRELSISTISTHVLSFSCADMESIRLMGTQLEGIGFALSSKSRKSWLVSIHIISRSFNMISLACWVFIIVVVYLPETATSDWWELTANRVANFCWLSILTTTLLCTALIAFRILRLGGIRTRFWRSLQVVIESSLIYVIILAISLPYEISTDIIFSMPETILQHILVPMSVSDTLPFVLTPRRLNISL